MQKIFLAFLKRALGNLLSEETLNQFAEYLRRLGYRGIDIAIAGLIAYLVQVLNAPDDGGVILAMGLPLGNENIDPTTNIVGSFAAVTLIRYLLPIILKILGAWIFPPIAVTLMLAIPANAIALEVVGQTSTQAGKPPIVRLNAKVEDGSRCIFFVFPPDNADVEANGTECQVVGIPGARHTVYIVELRKDGVDPPQTQIATTIEFGGTPIPIPPSPVPPTPTPPIPPLPTPPAPPTPPTPIPVIPDGEFGLTRWAYDRGMAMTDRIAIPSVAEFFRSISQQLKDGEPITVVITDRQKSYESNPRGFQMAIADYLAPLGSSWPDFKAALGLQLRKETFPRKANDYVSAGFAIADGLALVK